MKIKTLFFGTPVFAKIILEHLLETQYLDIVGVITQPDKFVGRKKILEFSAVKTLALETNLRLFQPTKLSQDSTAILEATNPELIIVAAYGKILKDEILNYPKYKCLNIHGSLLPILRGATPVQSTILQGLEKTGVTLQIMTSGIDEGDLISQQILEDTNLNEITSSELFLKLAELSKLLITNSLEKYLNGMITPLPQDKTLATFCSISDFSFERGEITPELETSIEIDRKIRAFDKDPGSWIRYKNLGIKQLQTIDKILKIHKAKNLEERTGERTLYLKCKDNKYIELEAIQKEGGKIISGKDFLNGLNLN